jgi:hypothetical protein
MFRNALQHLHKPLQGSVWTVLALVSLAGLIIGLDNTIMNDALLSLPGQLRAEDSTLQWIDRAKGISARRGQPHRRSVSAHSRGGLLFVVSLGRWSF